MNRQIAIVALVSLALFGATAAVFWPATQHGLCEMDDSVYCDSQGRARLAAPDDQKGDEDWIPLSWASLRLDDQIFGAGAWGHHTGNVLIHSASAVFVFLLFWLMTGSIWRSALVAALFAVHPLRVEPVAWIAERKEVQGGCLGFATLALYAGYCRRPRWWMFAAVLAVYAAAVFSKPSVVTWAFVMAMLDVWPMRRIAAISLSRYAGTGEGEGLQGPDAGHRSITSASDPHPNPLPAYGERGKEPSRFPRVHLGRILLEKGLVLLVAIISIVRTFMAEQQIGALSSGSRLSMLFRVSNAIVSYGRYIIRMVWFGALAVPYPLPKSWPPLYVLTSLALLITVTLGAFLTRRSRPWLLVSWLWYLGTLVPMIGIVQVGNHAMADRYAYIPSVGLLMMLAWSIPSSWIQTIAGRSMTAGLAGAVLVTLIFFTRGQLRLWEIDETLFRHALAVTENNEDAHGMLGQIYLNSSRLPEAESELRETVRLNPGSIADAANFTRALSRLGRHGEAVSEGQRAAAMGPKLGYTHLAYGEALEGAGRLRDAADQYYAATQVAPNDFRGHWRLSGVLSQLGDSRAAQESQIAERLNPHLANSKADQARRKAAAGDYSGAVALYQEALREHPSADVEVDLGVLMSQHNDHAGAERHFQNALRADPKNTNAMVNLALERVGQNRVNEARALYERALTQDPNHFDAHLNFAGLLLQSGQAQQSAAHSKRALELRPDSFEAAFNLGAAEESLGQAEAAMQHYRLALKLQPGDADARQALANLQRRVH